MSIISTAALCAAYAYAWFHIWGFLIKKASPPLLWAYGIACLFVTAICIIGVAGISMPFGLTRPIAHAGGYMLIFVLYFDILCFLSDTVSLLTRRLHQRFAASDGYRKAGVLLIAAAIAITVLGAVNAQDAKTVKYDIALRGQHRKTYRIAMVSDTHFGALYDADDLKELVDRLNAMQPDLILFAGDVVDRSHLAMDDADAYRREFLRLNATFGVYACMGNHDTYYGGDAMRQFFLGTPVVLLEDESVVIDGAFVLIGRRDEDIEDRAAMEELMADADPSLPAVVLDHQPNSLDEEEQAGAALVLSGHTHGGQVFPMTLVTAIFYEVPYGIAQKDGMNVVVSSGYGAWGTVVRVGTKREIVEIVLNVGLLGTL